MNRETILVGYITHAGYTRRIARAIARRLKARGFDTDIADLELCIRHPERYRGVVLGCATRHHEPARAMEAFIAENRETLARMPTAYFSIDGSSNAAAHLEAFLQRVDWRPSRVLVLPSIRGARFRRLRAWLQDRLDRSVTRVAAPTDWDRIRQFGDDIVAACRATRAASTMRAAADA